LNGEIAQVDHLAPGDSGMAGGDFCGDVICGLANDGEVVNYGVHDLFIVFEGSKISGQLFTVVNDDFEDLVAVHFIFRE